MDKDWKHKLVIELENYLKNLKSFKTKWVNIEIANFFKKIKMKVNNKLNQKDKFYDEALQYSKNIIRSLNENEKTIFGSIVNDIKNEQIELDNVLYYLSDKQKEIFNNWIFDYNELILYDELILTETSNKIYKKYKNIIILLIIIGGFTFSNFFIDYECLKNGMMLLDESLAMNCRNNFVGFALNRNNIYEKENNDNNKVYKIENYIENIFETDLLPPFQMQKCYKTKNDNSKVYKIYFKYDESYNRYPISEDFVNFLLKNLKRNEFQSIVSFAEFILNYYGIEITDSFKEFKELYEKSNDEILILDQRYYAEKNLIKQERALEQRQLEEEQEEEYRRQQLEVEREKNRMMRIANEDAERRHKESIRQSKKIADAQYDSQIAILRSELIAERSGAHTDYRKIASIENKINELQRKKHDG